MRSVLRSVTHIAGLWALAIAQPLFDLLNRAPEFFVAHRADATDLVVLALALVLLGPVVAFSVLALARAVSHRLATVVAAAMIGVLAGVFAVQIGYRVGAAGWTVTWVVGGIAAAAAAAAWSRSPGARSFLTILSSAAVIVPLLFLWNGLLRSSAADGATTPGEGREPSRTPVVVLVFDELSLVSLMDGERRINAKRFPNIAALAADGVWFRNATAVSDFTRWALPAILTGQYPRRASVPTPQDHPNTLFSLLGRTHRFEVHEAVTALCPPELCTPAVGSRRDRWLAVVRDMRVVAAHVFLPPVARERLPDLSANWAGFGAEGDGRADSVADGDDAASPATPGWQEVWRRAQGTDELATARDFIDGVSAADDPATVYFMHTLVTHNPPRWLPTGQKIANRPGVPGLRRGQWDEDEWLVSQHHYAHLLQAGLADFLVGRLRARLAAAGRYDEALVIITADHGVSFQPGSRMRHYTPESGPGVMPVPFIVKLPAGVAGPPKGTIDDSNIETIDLVPTVAQALGADVPWMIDGQSAIGPGPRRSEKRLFYNAASVHATYRPDEFAALRDAIVRRQSGLFLDEAWPMFSLPGLRHLIGRNVSDFQLGVTDLRLTLQDREAFEGVEPEAAEIPVQLVGRFRGGFTPAAEAARVAVALNGRIVATTRTWPGVVQFMAFVPPDALRPGDNDVGLFVVDPANPNRLLHNP